MKYDSQLQLLSSSLTEMRAVLGAAWIG